MQICLRIVPRGMPAAGCGDDYDDHEDMSEPADLVALEVLEDGEREMERRQCASWKDASRRLAELLSNKGAPS